VGGLTKPVTKKSLRVFHLVENVVDHAVKDVLVVENDADVRAMMVDLIGTDDVHLTEISSGEDALGASIGTSSTAS
jgi:hypothetical protein